MAMDNIRRPAELLNGFKSTFCKKYHAFCTVVKQVAIIVAESGFAFEIVVVVHEVDLETCIWQRRNLNDKGIVFFINNNVNAGEADNLVQAVATLVYRSETGHNNPHFYTGVESLNGQLIQYLRKIGVFKVRRKLIRYYQDTFFIVCRHAKELDYNEKNVIVILKIVCKITKILHSKLLLCSTKAISMVIFKKTDDLKVYLREQKAGGKTIGFVPTMGALHRGHTSLVSESHKAGDFVVCSIFVNPTQFTDKADFEKYPISVEDDIELLLKSGCDALFLPSVQEMYPNGTDETYSIDLGYLDTVLEAAHRPGHFQGVVQIVAKLLDAVEPDNLYMGQKDYQQCLVIDRMIALKRFDVKMHICPTQREDDGLAMSSRNRRLTEPQRGLSGLIYQCLVSIQSKKESGDFAVVQKECEDILRHKGFDPDYVALADAQDLTVLDNYEQGRKMVALIAVKIGSNRLIDNMLLQ